jgi:hypothetical protein
MPTVCEWVSLGGQTNERGSGRMNKIKRKTDFKWLKSISSFLIIVVPSLYFGYKNQTIQMGISLVMGAIAASFINIDKFSSFKGGGFEAELKKSVNDINTTVGGIIEIIKPLIIATTNLLIADSTIGGMSTNTKHELLIKLNDLINSLEINDIEIERIRINFCRDLVKCYYNDFVSSLDNKFIGFKTVLYKFTLPSMEDIKSEFEKNNISLDIINKQSSDLLSKYLSNRKELL